MVLRGNPPTLLPEGMRRRRARATGPAASLAPTAARRRLSGLRDWGGTDFGVNGYDPAAPGHARAGAFAPDLGNGNVLPSLDVR